MNTNILYMSIGAILIGFSPIVTRAVTLHPTTIGFYRFFFGAILMGVVLLFSKEKIDRIGLKSSWYFFALSGIFFGVDLWFWHRSIIYIGAGIATLLANTQVIHLALYSKIILKEKTAWFLYPSMVLTAVGITLASQPFFEMLHDFSWNKNSLGIFFGLATGITYAFITLFLRKGLNVYQSKGITPIFIVTLFAGITSMILSLIEGKLELASGKNLYFMIIYGMLIHFGGWVLITRSINAIPLVLASLLLLLQPIFATIFGHLIYQENLNAIQFIGLVLSLSGIYFSSISKRINK